MTSFTARGKPKRTVESIRIERTYRNVITLFLSGQLPAFTHERHVHVANILRHLPYGRELMRLGLQTMAYRRFVAGKYSAELTDAWWERLDGTLPDPAAFQGHGAARRVTERTDQDRQPELHPAEPDQATEGGDGHRRAERRCRPRPAGVGQRPGCHGPTIAGRGQEGKSGPTAVSQ